MFKLTTPNGILFISLKYGDIKHDVHGCFFLLLLHPYERGRKLLWIQKAFPWVFSSKRHTGMESRKSLPLILRSVYTVRCTTIHRRYTHTILRICNCMIVSVEKSDITSKNMFLLLLWEISCSQFVAIALNFSRACSSSFYCATPQTSDLDDDSCHV